jgi:N-acetylglucosamine-6-phosphate deacetylase
MFAELIYDREHVSQPATSILLRSKTPNHVVAVSDGTMASGLHDGARFTMWNHELEVKGGTVRLCGTSTLAGSAITLLDAFRNLEADFDSETAIRLCCLNPRRVLGLASEPRIYVEFDGERNVVNVRRVLP